MPDSTKQIGFRGTVEYRKALAQAALDRGLKVQGMLEKAIDMYLESTKDADAEGAAKAKPEKTATILGISPVPYPKGISKNSMTEFIECAINLGKLFESQQKGKIKIIRDVINGLMLELGGEHEERRQQR